MYHQFWAIFFFPKLHIFPVDSIIIEVNLLPSLKIELFFLLFLFSNDVTLNLKQTNLSQQNVCLPYQAWKKKSYIMYIQDCFLDIDILLLFTNKLTIQLFQSKPYLFNLVLWCMYVYLDNFLSVWMKILNAINFD